MDIRMKDTFIECLSQQLGEYEVLKSMYPNHGEIILGDKHLIDEINNFLNDKTEDIPGHLDFKLNLLINNLKLEVFIDLPSAYPKQQPDIYVSCNQMNRIGESKLNSELSKYIKENYLGEVCLYNAISWLQDNMYEFTIFTQEANSLADFEFESKEDEFVRFWVYSHHIYCKKKREEIVKRAKQLKLTGFSCPGKPGIICIEGRHKDCKKWWKYIKSMKWQKIVLSKTEIFTTTEAKSYKKFSYFEELKYNMKELAKYMSDLDLNNEFNELFGLCKDD